MISVTDIDHFDAATDNVFAASLDLELLVVMEDGYRTPGDKRSVLEPAIKASLTQDGLVQIVGSSVGDKPKRVGPRDSRVLAFAISQDGTRLVTGDDSSVRFYDTADYRELAAFRQKVPVKELKFTPDGTGLIVQFGGGSARPGIHVH